MWALKSMRSALGKEEGVGTVVCFSCGVDVDARDTYRKCSYLNCNVVYCGECKDNMFRHGRSAFFCAEHHFVATADGNPSSRGGGTSGGGKSLKREPPTPAKTPNTLEVYRMAGPKRVDTNVTPDGLKSEYRGGPSSSFPDDSSKMFEVPQDERQQRNAGSDNFLEKMEDTSASPRTAAAADEAARNAAAAVSTGQVNSIELLNKMLETKSDSKLMDGGDVQGSTDPNSVRPRYWTEEEDANLRAAVEQHGAKHWKTIAKFVPGRSHVQCLQRWNKVLKPGLRKGTWTEEEDSTLERLVTSMQPNVNWGEVALSIPGRSAKQCRERWSYNLDPNIKKDDWTEEEDDILLRAQQEVGNKWSTIAEKLPGRTENAIKTRFKSIMRAKKREWRPAEDALLLKYHEEMGNKWSEIAARLPPRTKNAVKTRYKFLTEDKPLKTLAEIQEMKNSQKQQQQQQDADKKSKSIVRTGASQSRRAIANSAEARARARVAAAAAAAAADAAAKDAARKGVPANGSVRANGQSFAHGNGMHAQTMTQAQSGQYPAANYMYMQQQQQQQQQQYMQMMFQQQQHSMGARMGMHMPVQHGYPHQQQQQSSFMTMQEQQQEQQQYAVQNGMRQHQKSSLTKKVSPMSFGTPDAFTPFSIPSSTQSTNKAVVNDLLDELAEIDYDAFTANNPGPFASNSNAYSNRRCHSIDELEETYSSAFDGLNLEQM